MDRRPIYLSLHAAGTPEHPRWVISDGWLRYWAGTGWSATQREALLYSDANEACAEMQRLLMLEYGNKPHRRYVAPVIVDVHSDTPVGLRDLQLWLSRSCRLLVNPPQKCHGPVEGSLGLVNIIWAELDEMTTT